MCSCLRVQVCCACLTFSCLPPPAPPPPSLSKLVERCLAWNPADRLSFREVLHTLENEYKALRGKAAGERQAGGAGGQVSWYLALGGKAAGEGQAGGGGQVSGYLALGGKAAGEEASVLLPHSHPARTPSRHCCCPWPPLNPKP